MESCDLLVVDATTGEQQCVKRCPLSAPKQNGKLCEPCASDQVWNPLEKACADECPAWMRANDAKVCQTCAMISPAAPFLRGETCAESCPETWDANKVC